MTVSKRARFEIFKRDGFACRYCGRTPPDVLLHVDHVIPRSDNGSDDPDNLTTACQDCNLGKSNKPLNQRLPSSPSVDEVRDRIEQAEAYLEAMKEVRSVRDQLTDLVFIAWAKAWDGGIVEKESGSYLEMPEGGYWPDKNSLRVLLRRLPLEGVYEAIDITAGRFPRKASYDSTRYFFGVCWRMVRDREGR